MKIPCYGHLPANKSYFYYQFPLNFQKVAKT